MERMEREQLKELVRDENWRRRMQSALEMTAGKDSDELDEEEVDLLTDYLCRLVPEDPMDEVLRGYLRREQERQAERLLADEDEEEDLPPPQGNYAPWRSWKPEDWRRFLEDTGVCDRPNAGQRRLDRQMEELLEQMKEERRRRERRCKQAKQAVLWAVLLQGGGICCGLLWKMATILGRMLSLPTWSACGLLGFLGILAVMAAAQVAGWIVGDDDTLDEEYDDDEWEDM